MATETFSDSDSKPTGFEKTAPAQRELPDVLSSAAKCRTDCQLSSKSTGKTELVADSSPKPSSSDTHVGSAGTRSKEDVLEILGFPSYRSSAETLFEEAGRGHSAEPHAKREKSNETTIPKISTEDTFAINLEGMPNLNKRINGKVPSWYELDLDEMSRRNVTDKRTGQVQNRTLESLRAQGSNPVAYINGGAWQPESTDSNKFPESLKGKHLDGWPKERWLDVRNIDAPNNSLAKILTDRLDLAKKMGFKAVDFDNVDGWDNETGIKISYSDGLKFNHWLSKEAHQRGLAILLKNNGKQSHELAPEFDAALVENVLRPHEGDPRTESYLEFSKHGKAVFDLEYKTPTDEMRKTAARYGYTVIEENLALDGSK
jgi:endo-alpha-1,4-polygalactosaminidase (GH114 family)